MEHQADFADLASLTEVDINRIDDNPAAWLVGREGLNDLDYQTNRGFVALRNAAKFGESEQLRLSDIHAAGRRADAAAATVARLSVNPDDAELAAAKARLLVARRDMLGNRAKLANKLRTQADNSISNHTVANLDTRARWAPPEYFDRTRDGLISTLDGLRSDPEGWNALYRRTTRAYTDALFDATGATNNAGLNRNGGGNQAAPSPTDRPPLNRLAYDYVGTSIDQDGAALEAARGRQNQEIPNRGERHVRFRLPEDHREHPPPARPRRSALFARSAEPGASNQIVYDFAKGEASAQQLDQMRQRAERLLRRVKLARSTLAATSRGAAREASQQRLRELEQINEQIINAIEHAAQNLRAAFEQMQDAQTRLSQLLRGI